MATKTVTVETDAYEKLVRARKDPRESFSSVVRRAVWLESPATASGILESLEALVAKDPSVLLDEAALNAMATRPRPARAESAWAASDND